MNYERERSIYDGELLTEEINEVWKDEAWASVEKTIYNYNHDSLVIMEQYYLYDSGEFVNYEQISITYNEYALPAELLGEVWADSLWINGFLETMTYDGQQNLIEVLEAGWQDSLWLNMMKRDFAYNDLGKLYLETLQMWQDSIWVNYMQAETNYNEAGDREIEVIRVWMMDDWYDVLKFVLYYDEMPSSLVAQTETFNLLSCYPNPFNSQTTVSFHLVESGQVSLKAYDVAGRVVTVLANNFLNAGYYSIPFGNSQMPSGVYFLRMESNGKSEVQKALLLK